MVFERIKNLNKKFFTKLYSTIKKYEIGEIKTGSLICYPIYLNCGDLIKIGRNFHAQRRIRLEAFNIDTYRYNKFRIMIGDNVHINWNCHIGAINKIEIHDNVLIGSNVLITDHQHGKITSEALKLPPEKRELWSKGPVIIERNVWIGEGVAVMPGVTIGENSIVGANSVVTKDIPANCVAAGNPTKIIRYL